MTIYWLMRNISNRSKTVGILRTMLMAFSVAALTVSCGGKDPMEGRWQLVEYCYGTDCVMLADHGVTQTWELTGEVETSATSDNVAAELRKGRIMQEGVMDDSITWWLNPQGDTLHICNSQGMSQDAFYVTELEGDTLVLSSLINKIMVRQRFMRM